MLFIFSDISIIKLNNITIAFNTIFIAHGFKIGIIYIAYNLGSC